MKFIFMDGHLADRPLCKCWFFWSV